LSDLEVETPYPEEQADEEVEKDNDEEIPQEASLVDIKYNDYAQKAYRKYKFKIPDEVDRYERRFLEDVDERNGKIKRKVYKVIRCRALDKDGKAQDYLYYVERWDGKDYLGNELPPVAEHVEGKYEEVQVRFKVDQRGKPKKSEPQQRGKKTVYYIPFKKSTLDKIIKDVDKDAIEYIVRIGNEKGDTRRDNTFDYNQFANLPYAKLIELSFQPGGPRATPYVHGVLEDKDKSKK